MSVGRVRTRMRPTESGGMTPSRRSRALARQIVSRVRQITFTSSDSSQSHPQQRFRCARPTSLDASSCALSRGARDATGARRRGEVQGDGAVRLRAQFTDEAPGRTTCPGRPVRHGDDVLRGTRHGELMSRAGGRDSAGPASSVTTDPRYQPHPSLGHGDLASARPTPSVRSRRRRTHAAARRLAGHDSSPSELFAASSRYGAARSDRPAVREHPRADLAFARATS